MVYISKAKWLKIFSALKSERRLRLLEYFKEKGESISFNAIRDETDLTDGNLVYHLNALLSANLIHNTTEKTEIGRRPYSYYGITNVGLSVLKTIRSGES